VELDDADDAFAKIEAAASQKKGSGKVGDEGEQDYVKPRRVAKVTTPAPAGYLETRNDVDGDLDRLRAALENAMGAGERSEIR
jgi:hypothetical protein